MSSYKLYNEDCMKIMKSMPDKSVDATVTDPPWNMGYFENDDKPWSEYKEWLSFVIKESERISTKAVFIFQSTKAIPFIADLFIGYDCFAAVKNFSQMTKSKLPNCWDIIFYKLTTGGGYLGNGRNWHIGNTAGMTYDKNSHPTARPLNTMKYILSMFDWETIFDPFAGSGTTGVAAVQLNKNFIGCEINEKYFKIAQERISNAQAQLHLPLITE